MRRAPVWLPGVLLLALLAAVALRYGEARRCFELLRGATPGWLLVAVLLQVASYFCTALIFRVGLRRSPAAVGLRSLVPLRLMKVFVDQIVPTAGIGGNVVVIRALMRRGVPRGVATAVVVVNLLGYYVAYAVAVALCLGILWWSHQLGTTVLWLVTVVALLAATVPAVVLWLARGGALRVPRWIRRLPGFTPILQSISEAPPAMIDDRRFLGAAAGLQFALFLLDATTLHVLFLSLGLSIRVDSVFASLILASIAATISLLPGGVGPFEAVSVGALRGMGVPLEASITGTILLRAFTLWLPLLPGLWLARRELRRAGAPPGAAGPPGRTIRTDVGRA